VNRLVHPFHAVALEEALLVDAFQAADDADRPVHQVRQHERHHRLVIMHEIELGEPCIRIEHLIPIGERAAGELGIALLFFAAHRRPGGIPARFRRHLAFDCARGLIFSQVLKARNSQASSRVHSA
jgi:hypothetical protein